MNVADFVANLTQKGVELWADNDKLSIRSPKGVLTPEVHTQLADHKAEILAFLREMDVAASSTPVAFSQGLSLQTIGRLIGGADKSTVACKQPVIEPRAMAQKLTVTFKPLPKGYKNEEIIKFRQELEDKLRSYGVKVESWQQATTEFSHEITLPVVGWKKKIKTRMVKPGVNAVIDVENNPGLINRLGICTAETLYQIYSQLISKNQKLSASRIALLSSWAEDHAAKYIADPMNTQAIVLAKLDNELVNPLIPYQQKIKIGLNTLIRTFSEIVIGVSEKKVSVLNMNLSDSSFSKGDVDKFVLNSLIPKIFVPVMPLLLSHFEIEQYDPCQSIYADKLVALGKELAETGLFPAGSTLSKIIKRKSHRDIVDVIVNGRTGVSYGFVAYAEAPQYVGEIEITEAEWENLFPIEGFSIDEVRQNAIGRRYLKTTIGAKQVFKQIPDIWLISSRSGSNKTNLNLTRDVVRIGLKDKLYLQLPLGVDPETDDIKPSYDLYVMLGIAMSAALYTPELIRNGAALVHFHGYPASEWFKPNEYYAGVNNPSVPCGTYESGVFNFLGISSLVNHQVENIALVSLIEPDHGTNVVAPNSEYLVERLKAGCEKGQIELGGKHFAALKAGGCDR